MKSTVTIHPLRFPVLAIAMILFWFSWGFDSPVTEAHECWNRILFVATLLILVVGGLTRRKVNESTGRDKDP
jgi:hypothetical protein